MKLKASYEIKIAKSKNRHTAPPLDLNKWREFIDLHQDYFTWEENTENGKKTLKEIDLVDDSFKERILYALDKKTCVAEYLEKKSYHAMSVTFYEDDINEISIIFNRKAKLEDLKVFLEMAEYIEANLYVESTKVTWEMLKERNNN